MNGWAIAAIVLAVWMAPGLYIAARIMLNEGAFMSIGRLVVFALGYPLMWLFS